VSVATADTRNPMTIRRNGFLVICSSLPSTRLPRGIGLIDEVEPNITAPAPSRPRAVRSKRPAAIACGARPMFNANPQRHKVFQVEQYSTSIHCRNRSTPTHQQQQG
jgi:hypothetical protein